MVTGGNRAAQPASPPQGICLCFLAAKFLSGGAPKRNCRLLSTVSYALSHRVAGFFCIQYRVVLCSNTHIQGGLFINFSTHTHTSSTDSVVPKPSLRAPNFIKQVLTEFLIYDPKQINTNLLKKQYIKQHKGIVSLKQCFTSGTLLYCGLWVL